MENKSFSISRKLIHLVVISFAFSVFLFIVVHLSLNKVLGTYFNSNQFMNYQAEMVTERLEQYIQKEKVASTDIVKLSQWTSKERYVLITVFKDGFLIYDSAYSKAEEKGYFQEKQRVSEKKYAKEVIFTDGKADVLVYDFHILEYLDRIFVAEFIGFSLLFFMLVLKGIKHRIKDIKRLNEEIYILEGGNLEYHINLNGNDELAQLAESIESLRVSFKDKLLVIEKLQNERKGLVTEMAHDMRTPLTALIMYLGFAKNNTRGDAEALNTYVDMAYSKAKFIKEFSDKLFEYSLLDTDVEMDLEVVTIEEAFYGNISDFVSYLSDNGFSIDMSSNFMTLCIQVNKEYISRILINLISNILKYGDKDIPIQIFFIEVMSSVEIHIINGTNGYSECNIESTMIGNRIIEKMMYAMHGKCNCHQNNNNYESVLIFPIVGER